MTETTRKVLVGAAVVVLLWGIAVAVLAYSARGEMLAGRAAAEEGVAALTAAHVTAAEAQLTAAQEHFARAGGRLRNPLVRAAAVLPVVGRNLSTVRMLADAGALAAGAGHQVAAAVGELPGGIEAFAPSQAALPVDALATISPAVTAARLQIDEALALVDATSPAGLVPQVSDARVELDAQLERAAGTLEVADPLVQALPRFLGAEGPRRYFFGAAQPAELRGSTGFIGAYAILTLDGGRFSFGQFQPIQDLPLTPPGTVPPPNPDFLQRYGDFGGTGYWQNLNVSPDFPTTGTAIERLWEHTYGERLDGTITADPFALAALLRLAGSTEVPGVGPVDADTVVPFVSNEAYAVLDDPEERKRLLGEVAAAALAGFLNTGLSPDRGGGTLPALRALGDATGDGHVLVHAADPEVQSAFEAAGIAGRLLDPPGDYFSAMVTGTSGSKVDYYLDRELDYVATLQPGGIARATATLRLRNDAPTSGLTSYVIGPNTDRVVAGENEVYVAGYLASSAELEGVTVDGGSGLGQLEQELGHPVIETFHELQSGASSELQYAIVTRQAWAQEGRAQRYRLTVQQQSTIRPTRVRIEVRPSEGMTAAEADGPWSMEGDVLRFEGELRGTFSAEVLFVPAADRSLFERVRGWLGESVLTSGGYKLPRSLR